MIEAKVREGEPAEFEYPKLLQGPNEVLILAIRDNGDPEQFAGVVVSSGTPAIPVGYYAENWYRDIYRPFTGEIILRNK